MIHIVTNKENVGEKCIKDFESFFEKYVLATDFTEIDLYVMKEIDDAVLLDANSGAIQTKFGLTDILHLSTGCKVVLSYLFITRQNDDVFFDIVLDITECGSNALSVLFDCANLLQDSKTVFLLRHSNNIISIKDGDFMVNGHKASSLYEGVVLYG